MTGCPVTSRLISRRIFLQDGGGRYTVDCVLVVESVESCANAFPLQLMAITHIVAPNKPTRPIMILIRISPFTRC